MTLPKIPLAQTVVQLCKLKGIKHIVISPGSRNAPLTIGFSNHPFFSCYSIIDERSAAFFALGIAQQLNEPVAVVCTSGSALLNYYPAIAEAYYSNIPLLVLSADRPKYLINIGDGQTINQRNVFANHILYSANLKENLDTEMINDEDEPKIIKNIENKLETFLELQKDIQQQNEIEINKAINEAINNRGPVHINVPFSEPLYELIEGFTISPKLIKSECNSPKIEDVSDYQDIWRKAKRKMVLVGVKVPNTIDQKYLDILANDLSVVVFTETTSNIHHDNFFPSIDKIIAPLRDSEFKALQPEILITFGGLIVSKKIKAFLRKYQPEHHWHVGEKKANDTFFCLDKHFKFDVNTFFDQFLEKKDKIDSDYQSYWSSVKQNRNKKHNQYLENSPYSDFKVFDTVLKQIPDDYLLHLGNSSTVRYAQLFNLNKSLKVFCNRGTSGIDGSTSTAIGASIVANNPTLLISGDLSFFYDSNALWNDYIPNSFRIIVINNGGGGIFRILPGHKNTENFDTFFETKHNLRAEHLCEMYGLEYCFSNSENELSKTLKPFFEESDKPKLLEIFTPRLLNDEILLNYFSFIK